MIMLHANHLRSLTNYSLFLGISVTTWFTVTCKDWLDEGERYVRNIADDGNELLSYSVYHVRNTTNGIVQSLLSETGWSRHLHI